MLCARIDLHAVIRVDLIEMPAQLLVHGHGHISILFGDPKIELASDFSCPEMG